MRKIYDYKDIRRLDELSINESIKKGLVITATSELASAMASYYPEYKVFDIHSFIKELIPEWEENVKDIKNYVILRNVIDDYVNDYNVREEVATYLRRNAVDMWNAIKLLIEADVYPDDIEQNMSEPIERFKHIWTNLEIENNQIMGFKKIFSFDLTQRKVILKKISNVVKEMKKNFFLFGFYFITPIQDRIFDVLENAGFTLNFLNCHDTRYAYATQIWEKTFGQYEKGEVEDLQKSISLDNYFGEALTGKKGDIPVKITKHHTQLEFAKMVKEAVDKDEVVYSPDSRQCEQILKEYYPEYYNQKHLLSYPVGQYIYYLHMMWNTFTNRIDMKYEYVFKCFASGWLVIENLNGKDYLHEMKNLEPYFKFCHNKEDWIERLHQLKEAKYVVNSFNEREKGEERWHYLMGNPFSNMAIYAITDKNINDICLLIDKLIEDANYLFLESGKADLYEHFQKVSKIIQEHMDEDELLSEESKIANELLIQLSDETTREIICPLNAVRDAIILLIGDHFGEYETLEEETFNKKRMVRPLSMVEAAMLDDFGQTAHIVLGNEFTLPGQPRKLPWPLTDRLIESLKIRGREKATKYVGDMKSVIKNRPLSYRYLFYSFMGISNTTNKPTLSIEWICKNDNKEIEVSPYVKLLSLKDFQFEDIFRKNEEYRKMLEENISHTNREIGMPSQDVPEEVKMDYLLCKERYLYSYLLNKLPSYMSEFHYSFGLSKMISAFTVISNFTKEEISKEISDLYPFLRHIELRQSTDFASSQGKPEPCLYDDVEYPAQRLLTHYLNDKVIEKARKREDEYTDTGKISNYIEPETCKYCPYSNICLVRYGEEVVRYE